MFNNEVWPVLTHIPCLIPVFAVFAQQKQLQYNSSKAATQVTEIKWPD